MKRNSCGKPPPSADTANASKGACAYTQLASLPLGANISGQSTESLSMPTGVMPQQLLSLDMMAPVVHLALSLSYGAVHLGSRLAEADAQQLVALRL